MVMDRWVVLGIVVFILAVIALTVILALPPKAQAPTTQPVGSAATSSPGSAAAEADLISADSPQPNATVASPFTVSGQARGTWYFEGSFPYQLLDSSGNVLAQGPVQAQGEWTTTDFVPFLATITFPAQPSGSTGVLVLKKDNPSGDLTRDAELDIPVQF